MKIYHNRFVRYKRRYHMTTISFCYRVNIFFFDKRHFTIYLIKLTTMTICSGIFVTKTRCNLKILINTSDHKQLLVLLWCLWQGIPLTRIDTTWDQIISCSFWTRDRKERSLYFQKSLLSKSIASEMVHLCSKNNIVSDRISA